MMSKVETRSRAASNNSSPKVSGQDTSLLAVNTKQLENKINGKLVSLEKILENFVSEFRSQLTEIKVQISNIESVFEKKFDDHRIEVGAKIAAMESTLMSSLKESKEVQSNLASKISVMEERLELMERRSIASDIIIAGIPPQHGEDASATFDAIAHTLDIQITGAVNIFRTSSRRKTSNTFIAKLPSISLKKLFLKKYYARMRSEQPLTLRDVGIESDSRIFINESLTSRMYGIKRFAERLKRNGDISSVFTLNGVVYIRVLANDEAIPVKSIEFLETKLQRRRSV